MGTLHAPPAHKRSSCPLAVQLIIPTDAAHETIAELGDLGLLQFKDLNPEREAFARTYASQVLSHRLPCALLQLIADPPAGCI